MAKQSPETGLFAAQQEFAADLDPLLAVIFDDIGRGIGLRPGLWQVGTCADDIDRCLGFGHQLAFGRAEARGRDDLHLMKSLAVQGIALGTQGIQQSFVRLSVADVRHECDARELRLEPAEIEMLVRWAKTGASPGNPSAALPSPDFGRDR